MRYEPRIHTGTTEQRVLGLLAEFVAIEHSGMLRMHAKSRERYRIDRELDAMGYGLWGAFNSDGELTGREEWLIAREKSLPHEPQCTWSPASNDCQCANPLRVRVPFYSPRSP